MNAEDWLKQFKEVSEDLIQAKADLHERNQLIRNGADFSKLNSKIRRQLNRIEREMRDLNDSLEHMIRRPKNFSLSERELSRRRDEFSNAQATFSDIQRVFRNTNLNSGNDLLNGGSNRQRGPATETQVTKDLDNREILQLQHKIIKAQDDDLDALSAALGRTKQIGLAISGELDEQSALLDNLENEIDVTDANINRENKRVTALMQKSKMGAGLCMIFLLFLVVLGLVIAMLHFVFRLF